MKLFINSGIYDRSCNGNVKFKTTNNGIKLIIPNWVESERRHEKITFIIPNTKGKDLTKDIFLENLILKKRKNNTFQFTQTKERNDRVIYALVRSISPVPDDIYINASTKANIKVICHMKFVDDEVNLGCFISNVYLIRINLQSDESIPIYLTSVSPFRLDSHYVFYKLKYNSIKVSGLKNTYIILKNKNRKEYISLSEI